MLLIAYADMLDLRVELYPFAQLAARMWEMRENVRCDDGWYVALAELLGAPVVTLDRRLAESTGPRCEFRTRPARAR
jgi:predicted nucleic acid-binding protein